MRIETTNGFSCPTPRPDGGLFRESMRADKSTRDDRRWCVQVSLRQVCVSLAVFTIVIHVVGTGARVYWDKSENWLVHGFYYEPERELPITFGQHPAPFWPRYWRAMLGGAWPGNYACECERSPGPFGSRFFASVATSEIQPEPNADGSASERSPRLRLLRLHYSRIWPALDSRRVQD